MKILGVIKRSSLLSATVLGTALTLLAVACDYHGVLEPLETWLYDQRARHFQYFTPPPTDRLVHLDVDDRALEVIGRWPWPRSTVAQIVDEVALAGPKAIALDVIFSEPQPPSFLPQPDETLKVIDHDAILAESLRRAGDALLPMSFEFRHADASHVNHAMVQELLNDLELTVDEVSQRLGVGGEEDTFLRCRREAMYRRIKDELLREPIDPEQLLAKLLPRTDLDLDSPLRRVFHEQHDRVVAEAELRRFSLPDRGGGTAVRALAIRQIPLPAFSRAAAAVGFADYLTLKDGFVRTVPLFVHRDGALYAQMGFLLACQTLGTTLEQVQFRDGAVVLPRRENSSLVIPVATIESSELGQTVGLLFDVPWFGPTNAPGQKGWEVMYDWPEHRKPVQHLPVLVVWDVCQTRRKIERNNEKADEAIKAMLSMLDPAKLEKFLAERIPLDDTSRREPIIEATLAEAQEWIEHFENLKAGELTEKEQIFLASARALPQTRQQNARLNQQLADLRGELSDRLKDRAVLIGWTATAAIADFVPTSLHDKCPGVVVHGTIFNAVMTGDFWRRAPGWVTLLVTAGLGVLTILAVGVLSPLGGLGVALSLGIGYALINGLVLFDYGNWIVGLAGPLLAVVLVWSGGTLTQVLIEIAERARITRRFRSYVDPTLVNYVIEHPEQARLEGEVRELTVVFTDLAGFTTLSERLGERTVSILNEFMGLMVPIIRANRGYVNKFLGDGIMFFFGAPRHNPQHATDAVTTVLRMQESLVEFNRKLAERGLPTVAMRAGISTGKMVVGDAGSADASDYTVLGDAVNFAARLESANKTTGTLVMISQRTSELLDGRFIVRPVGRLRVVGKQQAILTYELLGSAEGATEQQKCLAEISTALVETFKQRQFDECLRLVDRLKQHGDSSKLVTIYATLCKEYLRAAPGEPFEGEISLTEK